MAVGFDAVGPAGGGGAVTSTGVTPLTWAHINSAATNAILVGVNYRTGTTPQTTSIGYGSGPVALARLGTVPSGNVGGGGIELWGALGTSTALPTGSNTVSVAFTGGTGAAVCGGSVTLTGAGSFKTAVTNFDAGPVTTVSISVTSTTSGNMIFATACEGNGSAVFATTSPGTQRWAVNGDSTAGADNTVGGTWPSPGGTQVCTFTYTVGSADEWGIAAVEVVAAATGGTPQPAQFMTYNRPVTLRESYRQVR